MKKHYGREIALLALMLAVYHACAFLIPFAHTPVFWVAYGFGLAALVIQPPAFLAAFGGGRQNRLYGFPIARVSAIYLLIQLVVGFAAMAAGPWLPLGGVLLAEFLLLAAALVGMIVAGMMRSEIHRQDAGLKSSVDAMRTLQSKVGSLLAQTGDSPVRAELQRLADALRYSDPVSSEATRASEADLMEYVNEMEKALIDGDVQAAGALCDRASALLVERNRLCKLNKSKA